MKQLLAALAVIAVPLATQAAAAAEPDTARRDVTVGINDLDLSSAGDVAILEQRLARAVTEACGTAYFLDGPALRDLDRCRADARAQAELTRKAILARESDGKAFADRR